jgi:DNA-binding NarL/FixJ family response regulator
MSTPTAGGHGLPAGAVYEAVASDWARQLRLYTRSLRLYQEIARRQSDRQRRQARPAPAGAVLAQTRTPLTVLPRVIVPEHADGAPSQQRGGRVSGPGPLTARQLEIAELIARGLTNGQIAQELVLTPGTVGNHVAHILRRLGAKNRAQVAAWMTRRPGALDEVS